MGSVVGILSTIILASTVLTLVFAVGAYISSRRRQSAVASAAEEPVDLDVIYDKRPDPDRGAFRLKKDDVHHIFKPGEAGKAAMNVPTETPRPPARPRADARPHSPQLFKPYKPGGDDVPGTADSAPPRPPAE